MKFPPGVSGSVSSETRCERDTFPWIIARRYIQGLSQYLASAFPKQVWKAFGSWLRTYRPDLMPSEQVTMSALRYSLPTFLADSSVAPILTKFIRKRIDLKRTEGLRMIA